MSPRLQQTPSRLTMTKRVTLLFSTEGREYEELEEEKSVEQWISEGHFYMRGRRSTILLEGSQTSLARTCINLY